MVLLYLQKCLDTNKSFVHKIRLSGQKGDNHGAKLLQLVEKLFCAGYGYRFHHDNLLYYLYMLDYATKY